MSLSLLLHLLQLLVQHHVLHLKLLLEVQYLLRVHLLVVLMLARLLLAGEIRRLSCQLVIGWSCKLLVRGGMLLGNLRELLYMLWVELIVRLICWWNLGYVWRLGSHLLK
jgi:hypothetical protein